MPVSAIETGIGGAISGALLTVAAIRSVMTHSVPIEVSRIRPAVRRRHTGTASMAACVIGPQGRPPLRDEHVAQLHPRVPCSPVLVPLFWVPLGLPVLSRIAVEKALKRRDCRGAGVAAELLRGARRGRAGG